MCALDNRCLIVLGMHRSGTSAFTGLLQLHGVELGPHLLPATGANEAGYFEHRDIVVLHEQLLLALGSTWDDIRRLPSGWEFSEKAAPFREALAEILVRDFSSSPLWGLKDPRLCRLLPLWLPLLAELRCAPAFVLVTRHPMENCKSLEKRDGFSAAKSELLWLQHTLAAERATRGFPRAVITFDQMLENPSAAMERARRGTGVEWPKPPAANEAASFLDPGKRHHRLSTASPLSAWTEETFAALLAGADGRSAELIERIDRVQCGFDAAGELYDAALSEHAPELEQQLDAMRKDYANALEAMEKSRAKLKETKEKLARKSAALAAHKESHRRTEKTWLAKIGRALGHSNEKQP